MLDLRGTLVAKIDPVKDLSNLQQLHLQGTRVKDLSPLLELKELAYLFIDENQVGKDHT